MGPDCPPTPTVSPPTISQAKRAHYCLSWDERLARNARKTQTGQLTFKLFAIPEAFAGSVRTENTKAEPILDPVIHWAMKPSAS
ncbi:hypothetical protein KSC_108320 [Ktedonobacter sp. SOSP1-52]|nr:hypothetical protein KSC_108320 [Ktedonobacter sp. SOSP1-52]